MLLEFAFDAYTAELVLLSVTSLDVFRGNFYFYKTFVRNTLHLVNTCGILQNNLHSFHGLQGVWG